MTKKSISTLCAILLVLGLSACSQRDRATLVGGGVGAAVGYGVSGGHPGGALIGGGAGALIGNQLAR